MLAPTRCHTRTALAWIRFVAASLWLQHACLFCCSTAVPARIFVAPPRDIIDPDALMACYRTKYQHDALEETKKNWHKNTDYMPQTLAEWFLHTQVVSSGLQVRRRHNVRDTFRVEPWAC